MAKPTYSDILKKTSGTLSKNPQVSALAYQLAAQKSQLAQQGGSPEQGSHPSILNRIFDVIQRPSYAVQNAIKKSYDVEHGLNGNTPHGGFSGSVLKAIGSGAVAGFEGKGKTHFSDVLGSVQQAAPNPLTGNRVFRGVAGLAGDVAADPLSWTGLGIEKALPEVAATTEGLRAVNTAKGAKGITPDILESLGGAASEAAKAAKPGRVSLEVAGRPVASSEKVYSAAAKAFRPIKESEGGQLLSKLFQNKAYFPDEMNSIRRARTQAGISSFMEHEKSITNTLGKFLTPEEGKLVAHSLESGTDLTGVLSKGGLTSKAGLDLGDAQKYAVDLQKQLDTEAKVAGVKLRGQSLPTYVPKYVPQPETTSDALKAFRGVEWNLHNSGAVGKSFPTFTEYKNAGLHPHENIVDILKLNAAEVTRKIADAEFKNGALARYGTEIAGKGSVNAGEAATRIGKRLDSDLLKGTAYAGKKMYGPEELQTAFKRVNELYRSPEETRKFMNKYDQILRIWKTGVTTVNPSHHLGNMSGDAFVNMLGGVEDPRDYTRGLKAIRGQGEMAVEGALGKVSNEEVLARYHSNGAASGFSNTELIGSSTPGGNPVAERVSRAANTGMSKLRELTSKREDFMRMANFTHSIRQWAVDNGGVNNYSDLDKAAEYAAGRVRKYNFDFGDITPFESNLRRVVPFYTYTRKSIPLMLESLALHPGIIGRVPKSINAVQQLLGTDSGHLPINEVIPSYLKDIASIRIAGEGQHGLLQKLTGSNNAMYVDPRLPISQAAETFTGSPNDVIRKILGQTVARPAVEFGTKTSTLTGAPISGSALKYTEQQFPISRIASGIISPNKPKRVLGKGETTGSPVIKALEIFNPVSLRELTTQTQLSELRRQQDPVQAQLRAIRTKRLNKALGR